MGIFSKKKPAPEKKTAPKPAVSADDIWGAPSPRKKQETVTLRESKTGEPVTEKLEVESVDPEMIRKKMAELEEEIAKKKSQPVKTHSDYGTSTVGQEEILDAQEEYEKLYQAEHERYVASHQEDITVAQDEGMDEKMEAMYAEHEAKQQELKTTEFEFSEVGQEEVDKKVADLPYAKNPEEDPEYKHIEAVAKEASQEEVEALGSVDHSEDPDAIGEVDDDLLAKKVAEFEEKYGDRKRDDGQEDSEDGEDGE